MSPLAACAVVARDVEQRPEDRRAQDRLVGGHRVLEHDERRAAGRPAARSSRSGSAGSQNDQPTTSCRPWPASASSARRRRCCSRERRPGRPVRFSWIVAGSCSTPSSRATSSIRSASRVTSPRRQCGTLDVEPVARPRVTPKPSALEDLGAALPRDRRAEQRRRRARRAGGSAPAAASGAPPTSSVPGTSVAPVSSSISRVATAWASSAPSGGRPFSKRAEASLRRPIFDDVRLMFGPFQVATSSSTRVVVSCDLRAQRRPSRRRATSARRRRRSRRRRGRARAPGRRASSIVSPSRAARTTSRPPAMRSRSKACSGWPVSSIT